MVSKAVKSPHPKKGRIAYLHCLEKQLLSSFSNSGIVVELLFKGKDRDPPALCQLAKDPRPALQLGPSVSLDSWRLTLAWEMRA